MINTDDRPRAEQNQGREAAGRRPDLLAILVLLVVPAIFLADVLFGGKVLLPADDLFSYPPWNAFAAQFGIGAPHNHLIADSIFQNLSWKAFASQSIWHGEVPLWNPYLFAGVPFLAAGQYAVLYPLGALFYLMPVATAYGWFTFLHLFLGGLFMYVFLRVISVSRWGALVGGLSFAFSGFLVVSFVWPMVLSTAIWLPLLLAVVELSIRGIGAEGKGSATRERASGAWTASGSGTSTVGRSPGDGADRDVRPYDEGSPRGDTAESDVCPDDREWAHSDEGKADRDVLPYGVGGDARVRPRARSPWLWPLMGAIVVAMQFLAGHMEISFYVLFSAGGYAALRLICSYWRTRRGLRTLAAAFALLGMVGLGTGVAAVQIVPFAEAISTNFRAGFVTYEDVIGYALPKQRVLTFAVPDFFGNPAVHSFFDVNHGGMSSAQHVDPAGKTVDYVSDWDRKNYVEGASYVGLLPLLFALVALVFRRGRHTWILAGYAAWSLLLAFGSPLYRVFFYGIPGFDQLHTPFRWLFPYTVAVTALAGIGAGWLADGKAAVGRLRRFAWGIIGFAVLGLVALTGTLAFHGKALALAQRVFERSSRLPEAFSDARAFLAFEWRNAAVAVAFLLAGGILLLFASRRPQHRWRSLWGVLAVGVVVADLFVFGFDFNTKSDPALVDFVPPAVQFLQRDPELFRIVSVGEDDVLTPNTAMRFNLQDIRGYDTIIPRQYVDYWSLIEDPRGSLTYSKIHKLYDPQSLQSPLLDLLNVKYVLTTRPLDVPGYQLVYHGEIEIYRNERYLPRAFVVDDAGGVLVAPDRSAVSAALAKPGFDPRRQLVLEDADAPRDWTGAARSPALVNVVDYRPESVAIATESGGPGYLVLGDSYFTGWRATIDGEATTLYRADGNFRAVYLPAGNHQVVFRYRPDSFRAGLALTGVSLALLLMGLAYFLRPRGLLAAYGNASVQRVAKNSLMPMLMSLMNKLISTGFAMVTLRYLGPDGVGKYAFAIIVSGYFEIFTNFGLNTLLTREVAKDRTQGNRYLSNTTLLRLALWVVSVPLILGLLYFWHARYGLDSDTALAIIFLGAALLPGNLAAAFSSLFYAHERMEYPAVVSTVTTLLTVGLGTIALLSGWGFVGLAAVALAVNVVTAGIFGALATRVFFRPSLAADPTALGGMLRTAAPLMLNHLLATLFFRIDVLLLKPMQGDRAVGFYYTGYRFIDALNIIPSAFTFAIFPLMSRYAESGKETLMRAYGLALKLLLIISLPITVGTIFLATPIILFIGGPEYVPDAVIALQVLIWFLPFSYVNSVTQYVLIAVNQQRFITISFVGATAFNVVANLLLIPRHGYAGAALVTILSEIVLLAPFLYAVWRYVGPAPLLALAARPAIASAVMAGVLWRLPDVNPLLLVLLGMAVYSLALLALRTFDEQDRLLLRKLLRREAT